MTPSPFGRPGAPRRVMVVSSVHPPDDPRICHKLVATLAPSASVRYATTAPGPRSAVGFEVVPLIGGRLRRSLTASWLILRGGYDVASVHDPELLPAAVIAGLLGRTVVFDLHEDLPASMGQKRVIPGRLRGAGSWAAGQMLRLAERVIPVTLAEQGYRPLFARDHPVFPNFLADDDLPITPGGERGGVVYLGDVTEERGLLDAVAAVGRSSSSQLTLIGRAGNDVSEQIRAIAAESEVEVAFTGFLPPAEALPLVGRHAVALSVLHDLPNYRSSLPTKLLEYLAMGVPVVASDLPASRDALEGLAAVIWVEPGDQEAIAAAIDLVLADPEITDAAVRQAPDVRHRYRWPAEQVRRFYTEV